MSPHEDHSPNVPAGSFMARSADHKGSSPEAAAPARHERMVSLDVFRGLTIAGMILVNNPGSWRYVYPPLAHAEWHGWTPTDLIFPFFLFIVGVAIPLALGRRLERGESRSQLRWRILRRALILLALGLFLNGFPHFDLSRMRFPGVLQRIALCYLAAAFIFLKTGVRGQIGATIALLTGYGMLMKWVPVPGYGAGVLDKEGNLAAYLDRRLLDGHLYRPTWDPEGVLSTLPAIGTTLLGVLTARWVTSSRTAREKVLGLMGLGIAGVLLGQMLDRVFPINKNLWSSSFAVFTAGMAWLFLALCFWAVEMKRWRRPFIPFLIFGTNPIAVFVLSSLTARMLSLVSIAREDGSTLSLKAYLYERFFASWAGPWRGSLLFALAYVAFWIGPMALLYRKRVFLKV